MPPSLLSLPHELFLSILNQLVGTRNGNLPVAYPPSDPITKALRALSLTCRDVYPSASQYLYAHCLYLNTCTNYTCFRRTLGLDIGTHPMALEYGQAHRSDELFLGANIANHVTSLFISPERSQSCGSTTPIVRLPQVIDVCGTIGPTLRRLMMDLQPVYATPSEIYLNPQASRDKVLSSMCCLEELVVSYDLTDYFSRPPPNIQRLGITTQGTEDIILDWLYMMPNLSNLTLLRKPEMEAADIEKVFDRCPKSRQSCLDIVLVDVSANHQTPKETRGWTESDPVRFWEVDVPKSYYGDESDLILCDHWIWQQALRGTLFSTDRRRMMSWSEVKFKMDSITLAGVMM